MKKKSMNLNWMLSASAASMLALWAAVILFTSPQPSQTSTATGPNGMANFSRVTNSFETKKPSGSTALNTLNTLNPTSKNAREEWRPSNSMDATEREIEIAELEERVEKDEALRRLNAGQVTDTERADYGRIFERIVALKTVALQNDVTNLNLHFRALESTRAKRLAAAGLETKSSFHKE